MIKRVCNGCGKEFDHQDEIGGFSISKYMLSSSRHSDKLIQADFCVACTDSIIDELEQRCAVSPSTAVPASLIPFGEPDMLEPMVMPPIITCDHTL